MGLRVRTQVSGNAFILHCEGRIVFGDEGAALRERVGSLLSGTPKIVVNLGGVEHIDGNPGGLWSPNVTPLQLQLHSACGCRSLIGSKVKSLFRRATRVGMTCSKLFLFDMG